MKRVILIADAHCGHYGGLTPPAFQIKEQRRPKLYELQRESWEIFTKMRQEATATKHPKIVVCNGDMIEGNRFPNECIVADRREQSNMVCQIIRSFKPEHLIMTRGTPSHVGKEEDWEDTIADLMNGDIRSEQFINVEGYRIYTRHKIGRSSVPYGKASAMNRMKIWNQLKSSWGMEPKADCMFFSHVNYYHETSDWFGNKKSTAMCLPALQTVSQYGIKECEGVVHFGIVYMDIEDGKVVNKKELIEVVESSKPQEIII